MSGNKQARRRVYTHLETIVRETTSIINDIPSMGKTEKEQVYLMLALDKFLVGTITMENTIGLLGTPRSASFQAAVEDLLVAAQALRDKLIPKRDPDMKQQWQRDGTHKGRERNSFVLPRGYKEPTIIVSEPDFADGLAITFNFLRDLAAPAPGAADREPDSIRERARKILVDLGEEAPK